MMVGVPMRAMRDCALSNADFRVLICVAALARESGWCVEDIEEIAGLADLPVFSTAERIGRLRDRGYLRRRGRGQAKMLTVVADLPADQDPDLLPALMPEPVSAPRAANTGSTQAKLHSGMLRRRAGQSADTLEFDRPPRPHPMLAPLKETLRDDGNRIDAFQFWLRTIVDPDDLKVFSDWADRRPAEYRALVRKYECATDDQGIEALLEDALALLDREKAGSSR